jgi:hypothetical protein
MDNVTADGNEHADLVSLPFSDHPEQVADETGREDQAKLRHVHRTAKAALAISENPTSRYSRKRVLIGSSPLRTS